MEDIKVNSKVKIITSKSNISEFRIEKKGQVGVVLKISISLGKQIYWVKFKDTYNWLYREDIIVI